MLVKNIFVELRSRLRSCNVYITTNIDFSKNCNLKISIQANCIVLNYYNNRLKRSDSLSSIESLSDYSDDDENNVTCSIPIEEFCYVIPNSMSCLKIDKNTISFRILTEPKNGSFYSEFLSPSSLENKIKVSTMVINLKANEEVKIICGNCSNVISNDGIKFDRILELPTSNLDMSEWFCHGHGHSHGNTSSNIEIKPNKLDFLYRLTFFVVNNSTLAEKTNKFNMRRSIYHCNRCLAWLGLKTKDTVKLYNSEVKLLHNNIEKYAFTQKNSTDNNISIDDFIFTIEMMMNEFNLGLQYTVMYKIVLECAFSAANKQYLLIWVMDKELQVLRNNDDVILNDRIKLKSTFLTKILYKIETSLNEEVEAWLSDPSVISTDISKTMFSNGVDHLQKMSLKVPEMFRYTNGFCVSYLKV
ncbi:uncharacterized protein LOC123703804 [Colias croceus]|uniref:uncharacterized protein LOC123703804 n=1 Tax=Colias crocea TaxID=72248 RepID=UPI001E27AE28|nr:uncharacterized protein LOC123703804 [Colias croceus]